MPDGTHRGAERAPDQVRGWSYALPAPGELRVLRDRAELSQDDVAEHIGVSRQTIHAWESGTVSPSIETTRELLGLYRAEIAGQEVP